MARAPKPAAAIKPLKLPAVDKVTTKAPRLKPISTREYGKGGTPLSGAPDMGVRGGGIGFFGGPDDAV